VSGPLERRVRAWLVLFVIALVLSGLTAFPLEAETRWLVEIASRPFIAERWPALTSWVERVHLAIVDVNTRHPFFAYGTDWLAFAHIVIATAFWGPIKDPVRNKWVIDWAMLACVGVIPLALVCGHVRGIPMFWRMVDMSFGVIGLVPLLIVRRLIGSLEALNGES
jgi:hypothetical protein